tara:strand:+ start:3510 stop:3803 length:294 start_codon:yes stop_codon:yes gene_type:complete
LFGCGSCLSSPPRRPARSSSLAKVQNRGFARCLGKHSETLFGNRAAWRLPSGSELPGGSSLSGPSRNFVRSWCLQAPGPAGAASWHQLAGWRLNRQP